MAKIKANASNGRLTGILLTAKKGWIQSILSHSVGSERQSVNEKFLRGTNARLPFILPFATFGHHTHLASSVMLSATLLKYLFLFIIS